MVCNADGSCSVCAITSSLPHGGCDTLNPICKGNTECVCVQDPATTCSADIHSLCDGYASTDPFVGGSCICGTSSGGTGSACMSTMPSCKNDYFSAYTEATRESATCQVTFC